MSDPVIHCENCGPLDLDSGFDIESGSGHMSFVVRPHPPEDRGVVLSELLELMAMLSHVVPPQEA